MTENEISIEQKIAKGGTANGIVNNFYGMSPADALKIIMDLFEQNFPKLQEQAMATVNARVDELQRAVFQKIEEQHIIDFSAFSDPDVQYVFNEAQKSYARFGNRESLQTITGLLVKRIRENDQNDLLLRVSIDKAISISGMIKESHLDTLSLIFIAKHTMRTNIDTIEKLSVHLSETAKAFSKASETTFDSLNLHGCFQLRLQDAAEAISKAYGFDKKDIQNILPPIFSCVPGDYGLTPLGKILAISNAEQKTRFDYDPHIWIHD